MPVAWHRSRRSKQVSVGNSSRVFVQDQQNKPYRDSRRRLLTAHIFKLVVIFSIQSDMIERASRTNKNHEGTGFGLKSCNHENGNTSEELIGLGRAPRAHKDIEYGRKPLMNWIVLGRGGTKTTQTSKTGENPCMNWIDRGEGGAKPMTDAALAKMLRFGVHVKYGDGACAAHSNEELSANELLHTKTRRYLYMYACAIQQLYGTGTACARRRLETTPDEAR